MIEPESFCYYDEDLDDFVFICEACGGDGLAIEGWDCEECDGLGYFDD